MRRLVRIAPTLRLPEVQLVGKTGKVVPAALSVCLLRDPENRPSGLRAVVRDLTERFTIRQEKKKLEARLARAHKLETVGRLATSTTSDTQPPDLPFQMSPGDYVRLSFSDNGIGMDPDTTRRIFEPHYTTKASSSHPGLGLSSVHDIIKNHQGYVHLASEKGRGTTFTIWLPAE